MPIQSAFKALFGKIYGIVSQAKLKKTAYFSIQPLYSKVQDVFGKAKIKSLRS